MLLTIWLLWQQEVFCHYFVMNGSTISLFACTLEIFCLFIYLSRRRRRHAPTRAPSSRIYIADPFGYLERSWWPLLPCVKIHIWVFAWLSLENFAVGFNDYIYSLKQPAVLVFHWCWLMIIILKVYSSLYSMVILITNSHFQVL